MPKDQELDELNGWIPLWDKITPALLKECKVRINSKVYFEYNDEMLEAYDADLAWDRLMYRPDK